MLSCHNIKSVRSAEFWNWIDIDGYLVNVRLLLLLRRENEDVYSNPMKMCVSLNALRNKDRMDVETAVEIHRKAVQDAIPDENLSTTLVPELEFKHWKSNGTGILKYPIGISFSGKRSKLFVTDRLLHAVFMVDMHCPANVTLIAGGAEPGHTNGNGKHARFRHPAGIAVTAEDTLYVCDAGNGAIRILNLKSLFCHASQISQEEGESGGEDENCAVRRIRKVDVQDLTLTSEANLPCLASPFAMCSSTKDNSKFFVSDIRLKKVFCVSQISQDEETSSYAGKIKELVSFPRSSLPTAIALTRDERYIIVGDCDETGAKVHLCEVEGAMKLRTLSGTSSPMGIAVTENGRVFITSSKEHAIYSINEEELIAGNNPPERLFGGDVAGHRDGVKSTWNMPSAVCTYRNTVFVCDTGNKAVRIITSAKGLLPLQRVMGNYANVFKLDKKANLSDTRFLDKLKHVEDVVAFFASHEEYAFKRTGKRNTNGPDMTISRTTRQSFVIALESLASLVNTIREIGMEYLLDGIQFESLTTLAVESFFKLFQAFSAMDADAIRRLIGQQ